MDIDGGVNVTEDSEMAECDGDKVVTMMDVLQEQKDFEEDANAVLGASDDKNCTYSKGYIKRQAIYACLTCCPDVKTDPMKRAGVCLACSLNCHENHELVELYTKRNFKCDCGNPKFNSHPCQFTSSKPDLNEENIYNQNFSGLYCICKRPYPDPESTIEDDDMIQCIICEDWLHSSHLDAVVPANDQYSEMICKECMQKNEFLHDYTKFAVNIESEKADVDILTVNEDKNDTHCNGDEPKEILTNGELKNQSVLTEVTNGVDAEIESDNKNNKTDGDENKNIDEDTQNSNETENPASEEKHEESGVTDKIETKMNSDADTQKERESPAEEITEKPLESSTDKNVPSSDCEENINKGSDDKDQTSETLRKDDEQTASYVDGDSADFSKTGDDQLLDDIALSSDKSIDEAKPEENDAECLETTADTCQEQALEDNKEESSAISVTVDANPVSETTIVNELKTDNSDEKTDAVMDAIDELLKDPTDEKENNEQSNKELDPVKDTSAEPQEENNYETMESDNKQDIEVPEKTDSCENNVTDTEMKDCGNKESIENKTETESTEDSEIEPSSDKNLTDKETRKDLTKSDKHGDINNDTEPNNKDKFDTKNEPSLNENKVSDTSDNKRKLSIEVTGETSPKKAKLECVRSKGVKKVHLGATFWPSSFRQKLCTCSECLSMYRDLNVLFLTDLEDTVSAYESLGKENIDGGASQYEKGLQALSSLDRIQQINALTEYNKMRDKLLDFLKNFKDRKEIVKEEDIKAFFAGMKPKREPDGVYFCR